jgi:gluconate 5-dehydrogenase
MAEALAEAGATIRLNARIASTLRVVADALRDRGLKAEALAFDVTDLDAASVALMAALSADRSQS